MKITLFFTCDKGSHHNGDAVKYVSYLLSQHFKEIEYEAIYDYALVCYALEDESFKPLRPYYKEKMPSIDFTTGRFTIDYGNYNCEFKLTPEDYKLFCAASRSDAARLVACRVIDNLSSLDRLSRKAAAFDKDHFRAEVVKLFKENDLIPEDYPLPWGNKKKRTRTKAKTDKESKTPKE